MTKHTAMHTTPDDILGEIRDLHEFIRALLAPAGHTSWHWPSFYLLYVDMDRMAWRLRGARTALADEVLLATADVPRPAAERAEALDDAFADLGKVHARIVDRLWHVARNTMTVVGDPRLRRRLRAHFHPKSDWYQTLRSDCCPGRVSADGNTLGRTILKTDPAPPDRIHDLGAKNLHVHQSFDIGTDAARAVLARAVGQVEEEHAAVARAMADFFLAHCSIKQLLHPSSV